MNDVLASPAGGAGRRSSPLSWVMTAASSGNPSNSPSRIWQGLVGGFLARVSHLRCISGLCMVALVL